MPDKTKKREAPISYRPPRGLGEEFRSRVRDSGLSINAFITTAVFGQIPPRKARRSRIDDKTAATLLAQLARINDRLDGLVQPGDGECATALTACREALDEIRTCLMLVLGGKR